MGAYEFECDLAKGAGVKGLFNAQPVAVLGNGSVSAVRFRQTKVEGGQVVEVPGSEFDIACEMVILATGQSKQQELLSQIDGLSLDKGGRIVVDANGRSGNTKYFAGGDAVNGGAEVVNAAAEGKQAAKGIHRFLGA
jgi:glutamate synthase (NADPH/NADH) small chain